MLLFWSYQLRKTVFSEYNHPAIIYTALSFLALNIFRWFGLFYKTIQQFIDEEVSEWWKQKIRTFWSDALECSYSEHYDNMLPAMGWV